MEEKNTNRELVVFLSVSLVVVFSLSVAASASYLLFHALVEVFSIVVAASVFVIGWNTDRFVGKSIFRIIGIGYLCVAFVDLLHMLAYRGMGVFPGTDIDSNLATQLWVVARYIESITLLIAPYAMRKGCSRKRILAIYIAGTSLFIGSIWSGVFPVCWIVGQGLTPFKVGSEYLIIAILAASCFYYWKMATDLSQQVRGLLALALVFAIAQEFSFTLYTDPTGPANLLGHYFKLVSFYLIYRAFVSETLVSPYETMFRELSKHEEALKRANESLRLTNRAIRHDIRNEIQKAQMALALIRLQFDSDLVDELDRNTQTLTHLVESISAIEELDKPGGTREPVEVRDLVEQAVEGTSLEVSVTGSCTAIAGIPLVPAVRNIVRNAERHSGSTTLDIAITREGNWCCIRIADKGKGIPPDVRANLFREGFSHGSTAGTGLGLFIAKKVVTSYGGTIEAKENIPHGTIFEVRLPMSVDTVTNAE